MITEALLHCPGIGPARFDKLRSLGLRTWYDILERPDRVPAAWQEALVGECQRCVDALDTSNIDYFVKYLAPSDRWRILDRYLEQTSFFDIETAGLEYDDPITVVACWHRGRLHTFVENQNLDDLLDLLDDVTLLASFNGGSFDVPRVLTAFHIPELPCPHLDLRWLCYHHGFRGGLKEIKSRLGIARPPDLADADGALAVRLWARWEHFDERGARDLLIRYCASDVLLLLTLSDCILKRSQPTVEDLWSYLPSAEREGATASPTTAPRGPGVAPEGAFGAASPSRMRALRSRLVG
ncbi:MAG: ribonuclease H-like domain-containing protein [Planctomycetales bacterium]|nr:ribonuclease H-like domain-containing protein [Planctomycetales bacterium]